MKASIKLIKVLGILCLAFLLLMPGYYANA